MGSIHGARLQKQLVGSCSGALTVSAEGQLALPLLAYQYTVPTSLMRRVTLAVVAAAEADDDSQAGGSLSSVLASTHVYCCCTLPARSTASSATM